MTEASTGESAHQSFPLYRHTKCHDWGLAILAWERGDRRGYQFEDGKLRVIKQGYYPLLRKVDEQVDNASEVIAKLRRRAGAAIELRNAQHAVPVSPDAQLDDQLRIFRILYPKSFSDEAWLAKQRGQGAKRRLKRHRDAAIAEARELLAVGEIDPLLASQQYEDVVERMKKVLANSDLVSTGHLKQLGAITPQQYPNLAQSLRDLLYGEGEHAKRFDAFVRALSTPGQGKPSWTLATAIPALVHASEQVCVRPSSFSAQAKTLAPALRITSSPSGQRYVRLLQMAKDVAEHLVKSDMQPQDLMDIYDFMWTTLRPSARKLLTSATADEAAGEQTATSETMAAAA